MSVFNDEPLFDIRIEERDDEDGVNVHFGGDTLGFNPTTEDPGFSLTPDWNSHHFTLAVPEDSVLYHLTEEGVENNEGDRPGKGNLQPGEFIADVYGSVRALGPVVPAERLPVEEVGRPEFSEVKSYLIEKGVLEETDAGFTVDRTRKEQLVSSFHTDARRKYEFYERVLEWVEVDEALETGRVVYAVPDLDTVWLLFFFPDDYVSVVGLRQFYATLELLAGLRESESGGSGSQALHYLSRALNHEE
ncbi:hypothetical protein [Natrinema altunense]|uniref:Uncharacterized protein n=1 Tax=Natrinema altunense (strain JCM 12890 / CGMCC 1.3731 / AJ2) TaxID=1227494 RepID=L9ZDL6_NATA2|nr:hypothetical protein [Natrinema altunense]ELY83687.1 hypothetical protein C485_18082 [Natrinema altunense JCM 12890]